MTKKQILRSNLVDAILYAGVSSIIGLGIILIILIIKSCTN